MANNNFFRTLCTTSRIRSDSELPRQTRPARWPPPPHERPDGGVVTQRTANPCTPVRFRLGPPTDLLLKNNNLASQNHGAIPRVLRRSRPLRRSLQTSKYEDLCRFRSRVSALDLAVTVWRLRCRIFQLVDNETVCSVLPVATANPGQSDRLHGGVR